MNKRQLNFAEKPVQVLTLEELEKSSKRAIMRICRRVIP